MNNDEVSVADITVKVSTASTDFEKTNTELKRKYIIWNIEVFNILASKLSSSRGTFGTGYPFYALDENLQGTLPIIPEQIRYNRQLVKDGEPVAQSIWQCKSCLARNYKDMPDLKKICKPCPNVLDSLKPRRLINRLPDIDMWVICEDGKMENTQEELSQLLEMYGITTSDFDPISSIEDVYRIAKMIKSGKMPNIFLPIDCHIIEYSQLKELIEKVPRELEEAKERGLKPYLPIHPKSYRKVWQYDDEAYNFIADYLSALTPFTIPNELRQTLNRTRKKVSSEFTEEELFDFLLQASIPASFRRFQTIELEEYFLEKVRGWKNIDDRQTTGIEKNDESR